MNSSEIVETKEFFIKLNNLMKKLDPERKYLSEINSTQEGNEH